MRDGPAVRLGQHYTASFSNPGIVPKHIRPLGQRFASQINHLRIDAPTGRQLSSHITRGEFASVCGGLGNLTTDRAFSIVSGRLPHHRSSKSSPRIAARPGHSQAREISGTQVPVSKFEA